MTMNKFYFNEHKQDTWKCDWLIGHIKLAMIGTFVFMKPYISSLREFIQFIQFIYALIARLPRDSGLMSVLLALELEYKMFVGVHTSTILY